MVNQRKVAQLERNLLKGLQEDKEQVKIALEVVREFYSEFDLRGYSIIDVLSKTWDEYTMIFNVGQWSEEKAENTYDYDLTIVDGEGNIVYDESDGELPLGKVLGRFREVNEPLTY